MRMGEGVTSGEEQVWGGRRHVQQEQSTVGDGLGVWGGDQTQPPHLCRWCPLSQGGEWEQSLPQELMRVLERVARSRRTSPSRVLAVQKWGLCVPRWPRPWAWTGQ